MYTNKDKLNNKCTHNEYYDQFVNDHIIARVANRIGTARIIKSNDPHFNDIPLKEWDAIKVIGVSELMEQAGDYLTLSGQVCILKAAARQIKCT